MVKGRCRGFPTSFKREMYLKAYGGSILPCNGEKHWPPKEMLLDSPEVKVEPGRPMRNRRRDPPKDPKQPEKLTRHRREMTCKTCH